MANKTSIQVTQATHDIIMQIKLSRHLESADAVIRALLPSVERKGRELGESARGKEKAKP